jgi:hypothetical protein
MDKPSLLVSILFLITWASLDRTASRGNVALTKVRSDRACARHIPSASASWGPVLRETKKKVIRKVRQAISFVWRMSHSPWHPSNQTFGRPPNTGGM